MNRFGLGAAMNRFGLGPPADLPAAGARISVVTLRLVLVLVGASLSEVVYGSGGWLVLGILLALVAAWRPRHLLAWVLIVFLAVGELEHRATLTWRLPVLLAGLQLLHILGSLTLLLPWSAWLDPGVLRRPLLRFVAIQVPVQVFAASVVLLLAPNSHGHWPLTIPAFAVVGALALVALAVLLLSRRAA